ncbi:MAG: YiiD C-terminal domain-containing protein [Gemmatimonadota bacterium]|jgi:thioesterase domain-containing protein
MNVDSLQAYLHRHIPLCAAMGTRVAKVDPATVRLVAPLESNLNHRATAFGGSVAALAILAGWALVHVRLRSEGIDVHTVIQRSQVEYVEAIGGAFEARAIAPSESRWLRFRSMLDRWGRGRVGIRVEVWCGAALAAVLEGDFVSIQPSPES